MDRMKAKDIIMRKVRGLSTTPDMIHKVAALLQDKNTSARDLDKLISYDQAISSRLLKVANSAYYGFMREIATVQHAIVILGFKEVRSLTLGIAVFNTMTGVGKEKSIAHEEFWLHSIGTALGAQIICKKVGESDADTFFTAALLHDIGKLVLNDLFGSEYEKVLDAVRTNGKSMDKVEEKVMGFNHADVGGWMSEKWKLPPILVAPIRFHHRLQEVDVKYKRITSIVHVADILCKQAHIGNSRDDTITHVHPLAKEYLKLKEDTLTRIVEELGYEEKKVKSFFSSLSIKEKRNGSEKAS